jgi:hypothetical protein
MSDVTAISSTNRTVIGEIPGQNATIIAYIVGSSDT